jgi:hypothetical protein
MPILSVVAGVYADEEVRHDPSDGTAISLTRDDAQLVARLIARDSGTPLEGDRAQRSRRRGIDVVLGRSAAAAALLRAGQGTCASLPLFSYVMVAPCPAAAWAKRIGGWRDYVACGAHAHRQWRDNAHRVSASDDQDLYTTHGSRQLASRDTPTIPTAGGSFSRPQAHLREPNALWLSWTVHPTVHRATGKWPARRSRKLD